MCTLTSNFERVHVILGSFGALFSTLGGSSKMARHMSENLGLGDVHERTHIYAH